MSLQLQINPDQYWFTHIGNLLLLYFISLWLMIYHDPVCRPDICLSSALKPVRSPRSSFTAYTPGK